MFSCRLCVKVDSICSANSSDLRFGMEVGVGCWRCELEIELAPVVPIMGGDFFGGDG